mmetsp:Transcript_2653/g.8711  ORF Transcript_2653/g.8711 Transcript_2653/m.8711 type:complete len:304 (-) Transcript_2653:478-1389(-)
MQRRHAASAGGRAHRLRQAAASVPHAADGVVRSVPALAVACHAAPLAAAARSGPMRRDGRLHAAADGRQGPARRLCKRDAHRGRQRAAGRLSCHQPAVVDRAVCGGRPPGQDRRGVHLHRRDGPRDAAADAQPRVGDGAGRIPLRLHARLRPGGCRRPHLARAGRQDGPGRPVAAAHPQGAAAPHRTAVAPVHREDHGRPPGRAGPRLGARDVGLRHRRGISRRQAPRARRAPIRGRLHRQPQPPARVATPHADACRARGAARPRPQRHTAPHALLHLPLHLRHRVLARGPPDGAAGRRVVAR